ncbi:MAG TPA: dockerin type I repeat-containing protein [Tepidisphaeraceae bacterium]|nr:dockerin type I repeat-containing protein [Tepidisphaeraceae bacterium]
MRARGNRRALVTAVAAIAAWGQNASAADPFDIYPVVRTNDPLVGGAAGSKFTFFGAPSINASGTVAFRSQASGFSLYTGLPGAIVPVALSGAQAPDLPAGTTFSIPDSRVPINAAGAVAFASSYSGTASGRGGFVHAGGASASVVLPGDPLVGHPTGGTFDSFGTNGHRVLLADNETLAYHSWTSTFPNAGRFGVWAGPSKAGMTKAALSDDPAPTLPAGVHFNSIEYPVMNPSGVLAFRASLNGPGTTFYDRDGIWSGPANDVRPVVRSDAPAPGTASKFYSFSDPSISRSGQVAFHADLDFSSPFDQSEGIWAGTAGALRLVARAGTAAPGTGGATFGYFMGDPHVNSAGTVSFASPLSGAGISTTTNGRALFTGYDASHLTLVARTGDHAPGTPDGTVYAWPSDFAHALNDLGQIAFVASLTGGDVTSANDNGLWVYDPILGTRLVVREGQTLQVAPGVTRTVSSIDMLVDAATGDGRGTSLNDRGQIAFTLGFTSGINCGVFIADIGGVLPGDLDRDGLVSAADRAALSALIATPTSAGLALGDLNADGAITALDLAVLDSNMNQTIAAWAPPVDLRSSEVPEPGAAALVTLAAAGLLRRRRR